MARVLRRPISKAFEKEDYRVVVNQVTIGDRELIAQADSRIEYLYAGEHRTGSARSFNPYRQIRAVAYAALGELGGFANEEGREVFNSKVGADSVMRIRHAMSEEAFEQSWGLLDEDTVADILLCIYEVNPDLDPNPQARKPREDTSS